MNVRNLQSRIAEKSRILLEANRLSRAGSHWPARCLFRNAARMEEEIGAELKATGDQDWYVNVLSAASSWLQAGEAVRACENYLLVLREMPDININEDIAWLLSSPMPREWLQVRGNLPDLSALAFVPRSLPRKAHALVVGIDAYADSAIPPLRFAEKDAEAFSAFVSQLKSRVFSAERTMTVLGASATKARILRQIQAIARNAAPEDQVAIYFAGHGATAETGSRYLLAADSKTEDLKASALGLAELQVLLTEIRSNNILFLCDSCFSGRDRRRPLDFRRVAQRTLESSQWHELVRDGIAVLSACESNQTSFESEKLGHGVFTHFLLQALNMTKDAEEIRFVDILASIKSAVRTYALREFAEEQSPSLEAVLTDGTVPLYQARRFETLRLRLHIEAAISELTALLKDTSSHERDFHDFFSRYPSFLTTMHYDEVLTSPILKSDATLSLIPDFILGHRQTEDSLIVELKHPTKATSARVVKEAEIQMKQYLDFLSQPENRKAFCRRYGFGVMSVRGTIVVGKKPKLPELEDIRVVTYDEILAHLVEIAKLSTDT